jgi:Acetyltransferase (GNAT) domain
VTTDTVAVRTLTSYQAAQAEIWDDLVARSANGTFLHTRRFISYHGDRFRDCSLLFENQRGCTVGVFPAAQDPDDPDVIVSHPGLTYGGLIHDGSIRSMSMVDALAAIAAHYRGLGYQRLRYKPIPSIYHAVPAQDELYALFRLGARRCRSDLSVTIDLYNRNRMTERRVRSLKRANAAGVSTEESWDEIGDFWRLLELNLARRHGVRPVHSLEQITQLHSLFRDEIFLIIAKIDDQLVGGTVLFSAGPVLHMQYSATTAQGRATCATDPLMEHAIKLARKRDCRFFDFGTCGIDEARGLDEGLYQFKVSFGGGGVVYDHYNLDLWS